VLFNTIQPSLLSIEVMSYLPSTVFPGAADNEYSQADYLSPSTTPTKMSPTNSTSDMKILETVSMFSGETDQMTFASSAEGGVNAGTAADSDTVPMTVAVSMGEPAPPKTRARSIPIIEAAGGTDKCPKSGMRRDTIPMVEAIVSHDFVSEVLQFHEEFAEYDEKCGMTEEEVARRNNEGRANNDAIRSVLLGEDGSGAVAGVIVRCNPGTVSTNTQVKLDAMLVELDQKGVRVSLCFCAQVIYLDCRPYVDVANHVSVSLSKYRSCPILKSTNVWVRKMPLSKFATCDVGC
jgi:hypothetical protein